MSAVIEELWNNPTSAVIARLYILFATAITAFLIGLRIWVIMRLLPVIVPLLTVAAFTIVYIRLSCEGAGCGNVTEWQPHLTPFQEFMNNWEIG